jgi:branched-chain amino acid transport system ATP-binding protein
VNDPLLHADGVVAGYGANTVLHGVSIAVGRGELVSMVGLNGAGKSVALRCLAGLLLPWQGAVAFAGADITRLTPEARVGRGLKMVPQGRGIFPAFTVEQNLRIGAYRLRNRDFAARAEAIYARYPRLADRRAQRAGTLSGGEQAMLALGRALMDTPSMLLLDEPTAGLSPAATHEMAELVSELNGDGVTILLVEQSIGVALKLATRVLLMQKGEIIREASPGSLTDREALLDELGAGALYARERAKPRRKTRARAAKKAQPRRGATSRPAAKAAKRPRAGKRS